MSEEKMYNPEELGFTAEDLEGFVDTEPTENNTEEQPTETEEPNAEVTEEQEVQSEPQEEEKPHGNLNEALRIERARRKAAEQQAQAYQKAMEEARKNAQTQPKPQTIQEVAKARALEQLGITNPDELIYTDPTKYEEYITTRARIEYQAELEQQKQQALYNENVAFVNELRTAIPNLDAVIQFGIEELQNMPFKEVFPIDSAYARIGQGVGTKEDFQIIREFAKKCSDKMTAPVANVAEQAKALPKASALSGATGSGTEMTWEKAMQLYLSGNYEDIPPSMKKQFDEI